jgi:hypothetical protein
MHFYTMRREFDKVQRTLGDDTFHEYRDDWLNEAWVKISEIFVIPALKRTVTIDAVEDQARYLFPYDYGGTEVALGYKTSAGGASDRLDPVPEDTLNLAFEKRTGNMGRIIFYDWTQPIGSDLAQRTCTLVNNSATVTCAAAAATDVDQWIRFDPGLGGLTGDTLVPGDYGYRITAVTVGVSYTLDREYRGPAGIFIGRVRPAEQQQFIVYGTPAAALADAFTLIYYSVPRRLYNDSDVPEWPSISMGIVYMAIAIGYDFIQHTDMSRVWFGRAMNKIEGLKRRTKHSQTLIHDITIGSVSGRKTGPRGVIMGGTYVGRH